MGDEPNIEDIADGFALWQEHRPQSGEDWIKVAERCLTTDPKPENPSPLFAGLLLAVGRVRDLEARLARAEEEAKKNAHVAIQLEVAREAAAARVGAAERRAQRLEEERDRALENAREAGWFDNEAMERERDMARESLRGFVDQFSATGVLLPGNRPFGDIVARARRALAGEDTQ